MQGCGKTFGPWGQKIRARMRYIFNEILLDVHGCISLPRIHFIFTTVWGRLRVRELETGPMTPRELHGQMRLEPSRYLRFYIILTSQCCRFFKNNLAVLAPNSFLAPYPSSSRFQDLCLFQPFIARVSDCTGLLSH